MCDMTSQRRNFGENAVKIVGKRFEYALVASCPGCQAVKIRMKYYILSALGHSCVKRGQSE